MLGEMSLYFIREEQREGLFKENYSQYIFYIHLGEIEKYTKIYKKREKKRHPSFQEKIILVRIVILLGSN